MKFKNSTLFEAIIAVLPISLLILIVNFFLPEPISSYDLVGFIFGNVLLIGGMTLYNKGTKISLDPIGDAFGTHLTMKKKVWLIVLAGFILGFLITIAEPDLSVLGEQLGSIKLVLIITIAIGVGLFLALALLKTLLNWDFTVLILVLYAIVFVVAMFLDNQYFGLCFDSGGVTTGALTVPFILSFGAAVAGTVGGKNKSENSFGMTAICSVGPILMTMLLCIIFKPEVSTALEFNSADSLLSLTKNYVQAFGTYFLEVFIAIAPLAAVFYISNIFLFKLPKLQLIRISIGLLYTYVGLSLFLTGVNAAYMGTGYYIGHSLASVGSSWILIPVGALVGLFIILAEPAVSVLAKQVETVSSGTITKGAIKITLAVSMAFALAISMLRIIYSIPLLYVVGIGYIIALGLSFFVPKVYTSIAFDSGGVASGPMTATFLLPLAIGAAEQLQGTNSILTCAYGLVATVAMMPLISIQLLGLTAKIKERKALKVHEELASIAQEDIVDLN